MFWLATNWASPVEKRIKRGTGPACKGTSVGNPLLRDWGSDIHRVAAGQEGLANLMETWPHLTRAVATVPQVWCAHRPGKTLWSWRNDIECFIQVCIYQSRQNPGQNLMQNCRTRRSWPRRQRKPLSRIAVGTDRWEEMLPSGHFCVLLSKAPGEDVQVSLCGWQIFWSTLEIFFNRIWNAPCPSLPLSNRKNKGYRTPCTRESIPSFDRDDNSVSTAGMFMEGSHRTKSAAVSWDCHLGFTRPATAKKKGREKRT